MISCVVFALFYGHCHPDSLILGRALFDATFQWLIWFTSQIAMLCFVLCTFWGNVWDKVVKTKNQVKHVASSVISNPGSVLVHAVKGSVATEVFSYLPMCTAANLSETCNERHLNWLGKNRHLVNGLEYLARAIYTISNSKDQTQENVETLYLHDDDIGKLPRRYKDTGIMAAMVSVAKCRAFVPRLRFGVFRYRVSPKEDVIVVAVRGSNHTCESEEFRLSAVPSKQKGLKLNENLHAMAQQRAEILFSRVKPLLQEHPGKPLYFTGFGYGGSVAALACALYLNATGKRNAKAVVFAASDTGTQKVNCNFRRHVINLLSNSIQFPGTCSTYGNRMGFIPPGCTFVELEKNQQPILATEWILIHQDEKGVLYEDSGERIVRTPAKVKHFLDQIGGMFGPIPITDAREVHRRSSNGLGMCLWAKLNPMVIADLAALSSHVYRDECDRDFVKRVMCRFSRVHTVEISMKVLSTKVKTNIYCNAKEMAVVVAVRGSVSWQDLAEYYLYTQSQNSTEYGRQIANEHLHSMAQERAHLIYQEIKTYIEEYEKRGYQVYFTGHSYGGAVAPLLCLLYRNEHPRSNAKSVGFCSASVTVSSANHFFTDFSVNILNDGDLVPFISPHRIQKINEWLKLSQTFGGITQELVDKVHAALSSDERALIPAGVSLMVRSDDHGFALTVMSPERDEPRVYGSPLDDHKIINVVGNISLHDFFFVKPPPLDTLRQVRSALGWAKRAITKTARKFRS